MEAARADPAFQIRPAESGPTRVPDEISAEIVRLYNVGFPLVPMGGDDGKRPLGGTSPGDPRPEVRFVLGRMRGGTTYGVRLDNLLVVDLDTDTDEGRQYVEDHFGPAAVIVQTARGRHHYYNRPKGRLPSGLDQPGIKIDIKTGSTSVVVGPLSIRPDTGLVYEYLTDARLGEVALTDILPLPEPDKIRRGNRNNWLASRAAELAAYHDAESGLLADMLAERTFRCEEPGEITDAEVGRTVRKIWAYKVEGRLYAGRNSVFKVNRMALDQLENIKGGQDAMMLAFYLIANHGHIDDREFVIVPEAIIGAGHLRCMGHSSMYRAVNMLVKNNVLTVTGKQGHKKLYRINRAYLG